MKFWFNKFARKVESWFHRNTYSDLSDQQYELLCLLQELDFQVVINRTSTYLSKNEDLVLIMPYFSSDSNIYPVIRYNSKKDKLPDDFTQEGKYKIIRQSTTTSDLLYVKISDALYKVKNYSFAWSDIAKTFDVYSKEVYIKFKEDEQTRMNLEIEKAKRQILTGPILEKLHKNKPATQILRELRKAKD